MAKGSAPPAQGPAANPQAASSSAPMVVPTSTAGVGANPTIANNNTDTAIAASNVVAAADDEDEEEAFPMVKKITMTKDTQEDNIKGINDEFENKKIEEIVGDMPETVKLFGKDRYSTKYWTPVLFAIYNKQFRAVRYLIESQKMNPRYSTKRKEIKEDDTIYDQEIFPLIITMHNEDDEMLDYLWSMNELWDYEHLKLVLQTLFSRTHWAKGIDIILISEASQDAYNALPYELKKQFLIELFYRYLHQSDENIKNLIRESLIERPYALMSLHFLMAEKKPDNDPLIKEALSNIVMEDYIKMKFESGKEFMDSWVATLNDFTKKEEPLVDPANPNVKVEPHTKLANTVKK